MQAAATILKGEQSSLVQSTLYLQEENNKIINMCYYYITHYLISQRVCQKDPSGDTAKRYRQQGMSLVVASQLHCCNMNCIPSVRKRGISYLKMVELPSNSGVKSKESVIRENVIVQYLAH